MTEAKSLKYNKEQVVKKVHEKYGFLNSICISRDSEGLYYKITVDSKNNDLIESLDYLIESNNNEYRIRIKIFGVIPEDTPIAY